MRELLEKGFLLTFDELRILLYACGFRTIEGVFMPEKKYVEEEIIETLYRLNRRGFISAKEEAFVIDEELRKMLEVIGAPGNTFVQRRSDGQEYFGYESPDKIVVSELYRKKENMLKLTVFKPEDFHAWREEQQNDRDRSGSTDAGKIL